MKLIAPDNGLCCSALESSTDKTLPGTHAQMGAHTQAERRKLECAYPRVAANSSGVERPVQSLETRDLALRQLLSASREVRRGAPPRRGHSMREHASASGGCGVQSGGSVCAAEKTGASWWISEREGNVEEGKY